MSHDPVQMAEDFAAAEANRDMPAETSSRLDEIKARLAAATSGPYETDALQMLGPAGRRHVVRVIRRSDDRLSLKVIAQAETSDRYLGQLRADLTLLANAPADLAALLDEFAAVEAVIASDDEFRTPEGRAASLAERVKASLEHREGGAAQGWAYASTVEENGVQDRLAWQAEFDRAMNDLAAANERAGRLQGLLRDLWDARCAHDDADVVALRATFNEAPDAEDSLDAVEAAARALDDAWEAVGRELGEAPAPVEEVAP